MYELLAVVVVLFLAAMGAVAYGRYSAGSKRRLPPAPPARDMEEILPVLIEQEKEERRRVEAEGEKLEAEKTAKLEEQREEQREEAKSPPEDNELTRKLLEIGERTRRQ
jgi:hypothetical protein